VRSSRSSSHRILVDDAIVVVEKRPPYRLPENGALRSDIAVERGEVGTEILATFAVMPDPPMAFVGPDGPS